LQDVSQLGKEMDFKVFKDTVEHGGEVKAIVAEGAADNYTRVYLVYQNHIVSLLHHMSYEGMVFEYQYLLHLLQD
jgi:aspartyl-tRNA synthetase